MEILRAADLPFVWPTLDPFLFCVHHDDAYPAGNDALGPAASLAGRRMGMDFEGIDGWRMYHGDVVPGFPAHPHRGFETVTLVRRGRIDHADSLGATGRFGGGDAQWMTAGAGIVHSEMFPLLKDDAPNPCELFQIWLNLPAADKLVEPHYTMLWAEDIPVVEPAAGVTVTVVAGTLDGASPPSPPPSSWASDPAHAVAIWTIRLAPGAAWTAPPSPDGANRRLYLFEGDLIASEPLTAGPDGAELLLLQGRPIGEPVAHHGPFVMNTRAELVQAFADYQRTGFGGWPWDRPDPVHARTAGRFAHHADGTEERRGSG